MAIKSYWHFSGLSLALSLELAMNTSLSAMAGSQHTLQQQPEFSRGDAVVAQGTQRTQPSRRTRRRLGFKLRGVRPSGRFLEGGLARGSCTSDGRGISITPILPLTQPRLAEDGKRVVEVYSASTVSARPKFFVHIPQTSAKEAEFILLNEQGDRIVYEGTFALTGNPGIVSFSLPANAAGLEVGKTYQWSVQVICEAGGDGDNGANPTVEGLVQRIQPPAAVANIESAAPSDRPSLYAEADVWHDSVAALADLRSANPNDLTLKEDWVDLLKSVNLESVAEAPLVQCCTPTNQ